MAKQTPPSTDAFFSKERLDALQARGALPPITPNSPTRPPRVVLNDEDREAVRTSSSPSYDLDDAMGYALAAARTTPPAPETPKAPTIKPPSNRPARAKRSIEL